MSVHVTSWVWRLDVRGVDKLVLLSIADQANDEGVAWPSIPNIARRCGLSPRAVQYRLGALEKAGLITRVPVLRDNGSHTSNRYVVNYTPLWETNNGT